MTVLRVLNWRSRRSWASLRASLWRNGLRLLAAAAFAMMVTVIWHQFHKANLHLEEGREDMLGVAVLLLAAVFAVAGSLFMQVVYERFKRMSQCVLTKDLDAFMMIRDERVPYAIYLCLTLTGLFVLVLLGAADYPSSAAGALAMFSAACAIAFFLIVIWDMEDVNNSAWFRQRIDPTWWDLSVDEHFKIKLYELPARGAHRQPDAQLPDPPAASAAQAPSAPAAASPKIPAAP